MARDNQSLRRRAAFAVLSDVLDEDVLLQELWTLQTALRGDSVSDIIACVDGLGDRHLFDAGTRKRLYSEFFKALRAAESTLPLDPWPAMQSMRPQVAATPSAAVPPVAVPPAPVLAVPPPWSQPAYVPPAAVAVGAPVRSDVPLPAPPSVSALPVPPVFELEPRVVFGAVMRAVVAELDSAHREAMDEVRNDAMRAMAGSRASADIREQYGRAWDRALSHDWKLQGPTEDLVGLMQLTHGALVTAFGRVGADQIVGRAMNEAARLPEALHFPPRGLLAGA